MRFALLGDHPDGLDFARTLAASGRHALVVYAGPASGLDVLARDGLQPRRLNDLESALADPAVEAVIVAGRPAVRSQQLRRALQSEHHVLCIHPVDPSPDVGYEAALLQSDSRFILLPLLPEALHPGVKRFADLTATQTGDLAVGAPSQAPAKRPPLFEFERWSTESCLLGSDVDLHPSLPGWDVLRAVGGEIAEVFAQTTAGELLPRDPALLSGRFVDGGVWQARWLPYQSRAWWRLSLLGDTGRIDLEFPDGWAGPARLTHAGADGRTRTEEWPALNPWLPVLELFERLLAERQTCVQVIEPGTTETVCLTQADGRLGWLDAIRALELDDAARRSADRGRATTLDFQEATEEASFKGMMTLIGCGLLWLSLLILVLAIWLPVLRWGILPVFGVFLLLQLLRWVVPARKSQAGDD